jgi:hypothetical protein
MSMTGTARSDTATASSSLRQLRCQLGLAISSSRLGISSQILGYVSNALADPHVWNFSSDSETPQLAGSD